jgi:hypothetical protein
MQVKPRWSITTRFSRGLIEVQWLLNAYEQRNLYFRWLGQEGDEISAILRKNAFLAVHYSLQALANKS